MRFNDKRPITDPRLRLAAALLLHHGEISLGDIEALPFVGNPQVAELVANELSRVLGARREQRRRGGPSMTRWEDVMRLPHDAEAPTG